MLASPQLPAIPDHFETERLHLRVPRMGDGAMVNDAVRESFAELHQWMPWAAEIPSVAESETFAREAAMRFRNREEMALLVFRKTDGGLVGSSGFHTILWDVPKLEIGYWLRTSATGQGYMTEAVQGQVRFAFTILKLERITITCDVHNTRSAAVAQRAGFRLEGRLRHDRRNYTGELSDTFVFSLLRAEWEQTNTSPQRT